MLKTGIWGTAFMSICCFTPFLVVLFGFAGLAAAVAYLDFFLFPALGLFMLLTAYALWKRHQRLKNCECTPEGNEDAG